MRERGAGRRTGFFGSSKLKIIRTFLGVEPAKRNARNGVESPWPFRYLEKCMLAPVAWSRTWEKDDDWTGDWCDEYHATPKRSIEGNKEATSKVSAKLELVDHVDTPDTPTAKSVLTPLPAELYSIMTEEDTDVRDLRTYQPSALDLEKQARFDTQFGPIGSQEHRYVSQHMGGELPQLIVDEPPYFYIITTHISFMILIAFGRIRDFFGKRFKRKKYRHFQAADGYAALNNDFDNFFFRRLKTRMNDCFSRPITGVPGRYITLMDRKSSDYNKNFQFTGTYTETLNMSSYNYLGFAQSEGPCADDVEECIQELGISSASSRADAGTSDLTVEVERAIADFVGKPDSMVFSMGFSTNATSFPALVGSGCLVISDELNHASIRVGARLSGALIKSYKHNDMTDLERLLREFISQGQPETHRPWRKIMIVAEGLFSMEGTIADLPGLVRLKKKYKCYLFVDEAHSIGALGPRGRGVCDYFNIDPSEVDILMGTFTKSFGANGGYVAADKAIIDKLRVTNAAMLYGESPAPPVLMQILSSLKIIAGEAVPGQGLERLQRIAFNSRYLRLGLKRLGFIVYGHDDSPVVPIILYHPGKLPAFSHEMLKRKISIVIGGYPATPIISARARLCVSAAHNLEDMDRLLRACDEVGDALCLKFSSGIAGGTETLPEGVIHGDGNELGAQWQPPRWTLDEVLANGVRDAKMQLRHGVA